MAMRRRGVSGSGQFQGGAALGAWSRGSADDMGFWELRLQTARYRTGT